MSDRRGTDPAEPSALSGRSLGDTFPGVKTPVWVLLPLPPSSSWLRRTGRGREPTPKP